MKIKLFFALAFVSLTLISCDPSDNNSPTQNDDTFAENFGSEVSKDFIGQVVDTDNNPIQNATIKIGASTVQTDVNGVFIINGATVHENFAYIKATKAGYIDGSRAMVPTSGKNNVRIMLIPDTPLETVQSGVASEVSIYTGTKVNFDGAFQDENGNAYTGTVSVSMFHLTPSDENIDKLMPGMLYSQTATNEEAVLETFGMLNVELRGSAGQKLNIAEGHTAEITMRIDDSQLATAPSSIPLWHFDEEKGYWKEDGIATKVGNKYVGEVSHFSWWNCDMPNSSIRLTFTIVDSNNNPLTNVYINLINQSGAHASGRTDDNGQISGILPANQTFTIHVYDTEINSVNMGCGILYTATIGPYTSDAIVPTITLEASTIMSSNVTGTLLNCDNDIVTNGYIILKKGGVNTMFPVTNGSFSFNALYCQDNTQFSLIGMDNDSHQSSALSTFNFTSPTTNVQNITTCNTIYSYFTYQIDNGAVQYVPGFLVLADFGFETQVRSYSGPNETGQGLAVYGFYTGNVIGTYNDPSSFLTIQDVNYNFTNSVLTITSTGEGGGLYFDATVTGNFMGAQNSVHTMNINFHIFRP